MEELELQEKPGIFSRIAGVFTRERFDDADEDEIETAPRALTLRPAYKYAIAAANGLKRGEQQILNLAHTEPLLRQKVVDFMSGVNYAQEGSWEEIGDNIYLVVPSGAFVEVASPSGRTGTHRN
jgi:cell division inhibitor SepF